MISGPDARVAEEALDGWHPLPSSSDALLGPPLWTGVTEGGFDMRRRADRTASVPRRVARRLGLSGAIAIPIAVATMGAALAWTDPDDLSPAGQNADRPQVATD